MLDPTAATRNPAIAPSGSATTEAGHVIVLSPDRATEARLRDQASILEMIATSMPRADTLAFLERTGLAYVSLDTPMTRASNVVARHAAATHAVAGSPEAIRAAARPGTMAAAAPQMTALRIRAACS